MSANKYKYLFWDLDGTLTQSEFGIIDSVIYALEKMNIEPESREQLKKFIGPPLYESFKNFYNMTPEDAEEAVRLYREFYTKEGIYRAPLYDGIRETLEELSKQGFRHMVVTSKPADLADIVVTSNGIREYFDAVVGPTRAEKHSDKTFLIEAALKLSEMGNAADFGGVVTPGEVLDKAEDNDGNTVTLAADVKNETRQAAVMIGDRHYDINAAVKCGIDSIGVLFGYGSEEELVTAGATYIAKTAEGIIEYAAK